MQFQEVGTTTGSFPAAAPVAPPAGGIDKALATSGALNSVDAVVGKYAAGLVRTDAKTWLSDAATTSALNGLFYYVAREEQAIRRDPVKRTSDILRKVFGG